MLKHLYAVILAGGRGERFWPLSTAARPKQFLALIGGQPLITQAVERLEGLIPPERVLIITAGKLVEATRRAAPRLPAGNVIGEPVGRDTAAACALGTTLAKARDPHAVVCILTADQIVGDLAVFRATLRASAAVAAGSDALVTIGIRPALASTGFGYIETAGRLVRRDGVEFLKVKRFVEKPDRATAERFVAARRFFWNSGMFIWSADSFFQALDRHRPPLLAAVARLSAAVGTRRWKAALKEEYGKLDRISVDYAIMEKADNILMARGEFAWDDVGSWPALANHLPADASGNVVVGLCEVMDAKGNVVVSPDRLTALIGVEDLVVVHSEKATLICPRSRAQEVRKIVQRLAEEGRLVG